MNHDEDRFRTDFFVPSQFAITRKAGGKLMTDNYVSRSAVRSSDWRTAGNDLVGVDLKETIIRIVIPIIVDRI